MKLYGAQGVSPQVLLAYALSHGYQLSPPPALARTPLGKPYFPQYPHLHINWSHSGSLVLCALSDSPVGVDVEWVRPRAATLPRYALTPEEYDAFQHQGGDWSAFYGLWTKKEAWCKYTGQGLRRHWGASPPKTGLFFQTYAGSGWRACVCGEAYIGRMDKACHAYNYRRTPRTETLFAPPGTAYIYLIYGMYHCLNFVTEPEGEPCAVLIRGGQPRGSLSFLARNRYGVGWEQLSAYQRKNFLNGPGKLCQALALTRAENGCSLLGDSLFVCDRLEDLGLTTPPEDLRPFSIVAGPRKKPSPQHHCPGVVRQSLKQQTIDRLSQGLGAVGRSQHRGHHLSQQIRRGLPLHGG